MTKNESTQIRQSLLTAGLILAVALLMAAAGKSGWIDDETSKRIMQVVIGAVIMVMGNTLPKTLEPLNSSCNPARVQAVQRFAGWTLALAGIGYAAVWILAPLDVARTLGMVLMIAALVLVGGAVARAKWGRN